MTIHVGFDLDGVFADFQSRWEEMFKPANDDRYTWDRYNGFDKWYTSEEFKIQTKHMGVMGEYACLDLYPGAKKCWQRIRALPDVKIHVMTHRPKEAWKGTIEWLNKNGLNCDTLTFTGDKRVLKGLAGPDAGMLIAIDDYQRHVVEMREAGIVSILCDRPWNADAPESHSKHGLDWFADFVEIWAT